VSELEDELGGTSALRDRKGCRRGGGLALVADDNPLSEKARLSGGVPEFGDADEPWLLPVAC